MGESPVLCPATTALWAPDLQNRLARAATDTATLAPTVDRAVAAYRDGIDTLVHLPGDDREFAQALEEFTAVRVLATELMGLANRIDRALWG